MKASEVKRLYAAGERDFRRQDLSGQSLQGQNLAGADFSGSNIRGTNFSGANLTDANFMGVTAGVQKRWIGGQLCLLLLLSALAGFLQGYFGYWVAYYFPRWWDAAYDWSYFTTDLIFTVTYPIVLVITFVAIARQGFTAKAATTIGLAGAGAGAGAVAVAVAVASLLLGIYCSRRARRGDARFALLQSAGVALGALGGTRFYQSTLTRANFTRATLKSTNFREATLTHVCWHAASHLDRARLGDAILSNSAVRELLVSRNGYKKAYVKANFREANLTGINLEQANLTSADLSGATLQQASLRAANLREVLAIGTDFTGSTLTGACLEAWNVDHTTILKDVDCQYVFLLEQPNALGSHERRPHDPEEVFQPGDFARLYTKMINVVQVLLRNGMKNQAAFNEAFQQLLAEQPTLSRESIQTIDRKGEDALVTLEVPETADKGAIARSLRQFYEDKVLRLEAKVEELHQLRAADLKEVASAQKAQIFNQVAGGNAMNEINQSRNINVGGDLNATGSTFNLGEISGNVTNTINQLQAANPQATELADLLKQLQSAIESESDLPPADKTEALEQVSTLAKAGANPQDGTLKKLAGTSVKILKGTIAALPSTATIVKACSELLPAISKLLGL